MDIKDAEKNIISVSLFKVKTAEEIFADVKKCGAMTVTKDDIPQCILLSPMEYSRIMDELEIAKLEKDLSEEITYDDLLIETDRIEN